MKKEKMTVIEKASAWKCRKCESFVKLTAESINQKKVYFLCSAVNSTATIDQDITYFKKCPIK